MVSFALITGLGLLLSLFFLMIETTLILLSKKVVFNRVRMLLGRGIGYGKVRIIRNNGTMAEHIKKFSVDGFEIDKCHYRYDQQRAYTDIEGAKLIYYRLGDAEPLDLMQEDIPVIDAKMYANDLNKAMAAGAMSVTQNAGISKETVVVLIAAGVTILVGILMFKVSGDVSELLKIVKGA